MPQCTYDGLNFGANAKKETFQDHEEVFYCETTREIFRDYEDYFRHIMAINSTIWCCEVTGKDKLTYEEALRSERNARRKLETFKDVLRPPTLLLVEQAQHTSLRSLSALTYRFLRYRFFYNERVQVYQRTPSLSSTYHYIITDIVWPYSQIPPDRIYTQPEKMRYRLRCLEKNSNVGDSLVVPFDKLRRDRTEMSWENIYTFLKNNTVRMGGVLRPKPESVKKYITDRGLTFDKMFIGNIPKFPPAKPRTKSSTLNSSNVSEKSPLGGNTGKKQSNLDTYLVSDDVRTTTLGKQMKSTNNNNMRSSTGNKQGATSQQYNGALAKEKKKIELAEKAKHEEELKAKSLKEEMERVRQQRIQAAMEQERIKAEKKAQLNALIDAQCNALLIATDDLERSDQRMLPAYNPLRSLIPTKYLGDAFALREFLHSYSEILAGIEVFRGNISFYELSRAFTVREVAGPLSDILCVLLGTILGLQREEEEECLVEYVNGVIGPGSQEPFTTMSLAARAHHYTKRHFASKLNELPVDALTLSEVLRLHLLSSGALLRNRRAEKWRVMYRNGYSSSEDPGLELRMRYPHILNALKLYTIYQLPYRDILCVIRCLMDQLLTYSGMISVIEERMDQIASARQEVKNLMLLENQRLTKLQAEKRAFTNEFHLQCMDNSVKNSAEKRRALEEKFNKKTAELLANSDREHKKYQQQISKVNATLFNHLVYLGMDRAYRKYYIWESLPGIFIEHPKECYDKCLTNPPKNDPQSLHLLPDADKLPRNRKDLRTYLMRKYHEDELKLRKTTVQNPLVAGDNSTIDNAESAKTVHDKESKENKKNHLNGQLNGGYSSHSNHHQNEEIVKNNSVDGAIGIEKQNVTVTEKTPVEPTQYELFMCTGNPKHCRVHDENNVDRQLWSYIYQSDEIDALINSLNSLGNRESELRNQLITYKEFILKHVRNCPVDMLSIDSKNLTRSKRSMILDTQRKYQNANFGYSKDKVDLNDVMFTALSDRIVQFEKELYRGSLGVLKVKNMEKWRNDLLSGLYDPQVKIQWGVMKPAAYSNYTNMSLIDTVNQERRKSEERNNNTQESMDNNEEEATNGQEDEVIQYAGKPYHDPGEHIVGTLQVESEEGTSDEDNTLQNSDTHRARVKQLASALLQVEQAVERRFLKEPFGTALLKDREQQERKQQMANNRLRQWEVSLMESSSFSQIFLHLNVLHDSILWARSTTKSNCMVCRRGSEPDKLLLCDECNGGTHMFCMKPKMETIPEGNWYCKRCVVQFGLKNESTKETKVAEERKRKRAFLMDEENSDASSLASVDIRRTRSSGRGTVSNQPTIDGGGRRSRRAPLHNNTADDDAEQKDSENEENDDDEAVVEGDENDVDDNQSGEDEQHEQHEHEENVVDEMAHKADALEDEDENEEEEYNSDDEHIENEEDDESSGHHVAVTSKQYDEDKEEYNEEVDEREDDVPPSDGNSDDEQSTNIGSSQKGETESQSTFEVKLKAHRGKRRRLRNASGGSENNEESSDENEKLATPAKRVRRSFGARRRSPSEETARANGHTSSRRSLRHSNNSLPLDNRVLQQLLTRIMKEENAWPFLRPVSQAEVPDYYEIIKQPMDFAKIKSNLNIGAYGNNSEVLRDIELIFQNCDCYNMVGDEIYKAGCALEKSVIAWCEELRLPFQPSDMNAVE